MAIQTKITLIYIILEFKFLILLVFIVQSPKPLYILKPEKSCPDKTCPIYLINILFNNLNINNNLILLILKGDLI